MEPSRQRAQPRVPPYSANRSFGLGASHQDDIGHTPPRTMGSWRAMGSTDNTKQASSSVISGRKLFNRSQNPSRVGSNTTRSFSDVPTNTPGRIFASSSSFRSGLTNGSAPKFAFSPRLPASTVREKFPAVASGRSFRGPSVDLSGKSMSKTTASNLFTMRITSPPPELDGEELAKQVPQDPNRIGSIYADEYLAHLVPSELDELQRRQFFCILDLRRLKYAANEIFAKKDWRVNIMNFAKEYEKSRSLIMLRYGLYEFKTVPASREVLKKWKMDHNIPDEDEEMTDDVRSKPSGGQSSFRSNLKRRAEDDLNTTAGSSQAKRRVSERSPLNESAAPTSNAGATPFPKKTKRMSEDIDEDEENQPSKIQKSKPSATLSIFEQVANNSPAKQPAKAVAETPAISKSSSSLFAQPAPSVLSGGSKMLAPSGNIFGHLSEQNTPAGSDGEEDSDAEAEDDGEEDEEEEGGGEDEDDNDVEEVPAPEEKTTSTAPTFGTPSSSLFGGTKPSAASGGSTLFGQGASFMDRASKASDAETAKASEVPSSSPIKAKDQTWNPNTPIKFGANGPDATSTPMFGAKTAQPSSLFAKPTEPPSFKFGSTETPKPTATPTFGTQVKDFASETPSAFSSTPFGQASKPADTGSSPFGNAAKTPLFGQSKEPEASGATPPTSSLFGSKTPGLASTTPFGKPPGDVSVLETSTTPFGKPPADAAASESQTKSLFGGPSSTTPSTQPQTNSLFGAKTDKPAGSLFGTSNDKPTTSLFGATNGDKPAATSTLFGAPSTTVDKQDTASKKRRADSDDAEEQPNKKYTFGGDAPSFSDKLPPKTPAAAKGATDAASVFGAPAAADKKYLFGGPSTTPAAPPSTTPAPTTAPASLFGKTTTPATTEPAKTQSSLFGAPSANTGSTGFTFGSTTPATNPPTSLFGSQNTTSTSHPPTSNLFGSQNNSSASTGGGLFGSQTTQAPTSSLFSSAKNDPASTTQGTSFSFGGNNAAPATSTGSFTFNAGGGNDSFNNPFSNGGGSQAPSFEFGAASNTSGAAPFQFGGGGSSSTPAPATFGFGAGSQPTNGTSAPSGSLFGGGAAPTNGSSSSMFSFGGSSQQPSQSAPSLFSGQPANAAQGIFASQLAAPPTGSSTGTNTPLFGGASSLATTPAAGTPEPEASKKDGANGTADEDDTPQDQQVSLTDAGPGEEDEEVVHEVRAKALRHVPVKPDDDPETKKNASPWQPEGLGPLRILKHKTSGSVRILLRTEPSGRVAMNKLLLPNFTYKVDSGAKWLKVTTAKDDGKGLETWMIQVKNNEFAVKLAAVLEDNKNANK